jgi:geranylgeranyl diphosphate synthase, type I
MSAEKITLDAVTERMRALVDYEPGAAATASMDHLATRGSMSRARLALSACGALGVDARQSLAIAVACELLHNASLVHDDLQDQDRERRGMPSVWARHGASTAICVGDLMISAAYASLAEIQAPGTIQVAHKAISRAIAGQCADLAARGAARPSQSSHEEISRNKAGALFALPLQLALMTAGLATECAMARDASNHFAIGYQILDDIDDVNSDARNGELNIVTILRARCDRDPVGSAQHLARRHLEMACELAVQLPQGSGATLHELARLLLLRTGQSSISQVVFV